MDNTFKNLLSNHILEQEKIKFLEDLKICYNRCGNQKGRKFLKDMISIIENEYKMTEKQFAACLRAVEHYRLEEEREDDYHEKELEYIAGEAMLDVYGND